ncbi:hypothetical protein IJH89_00165 [Candidatus Saccharibacteria bacterium]|nr:hypothetical protein [Candidatus Saccharibacteria bacterium]
MKILEKVKVSVLALALVLAGVGVAMVPRAAVYADEACTGGKDCVEAGMEATGLKDEGENKDLVGMVKTIINVILYIVGILAVVMIIYGGVQYTISAGDQGTVTKAKNTIIYGIVGLVIAILAYAIVAFVVSKL